MFENKFDFALDLESITIKEQIIMGFDDIIFDNGIKAKTLETLRPLIGQYNYEKWDKIEEMETGEMCYSAYSLIFKQIHSINYVLAVGACPFPLNEEQKLNIIKRTRMEVLQVFFDEVDDEDIQGEITEHLEPLIDEEMKRLSQM